MRGKYLLLQIKLGFIKNFLDHVIDESGKEYLVLQQKLEEGGFTDFGEWESASDYPFARQEIGARAVYYEINALIESELRDSARQAWMESSKYRGRKTLDFTKPLPEAVRTLKTIYDLSLKDVIELIEKKYNVKIDNLEGVEIFSEIRELVNAYKHRKGFVDERKQWLEGRFAERYTTNVEKAYEAIDKAEVFIRALWKATNREPLPHINRDEWDELELE